MAANAKGKQRAAENAEELAATLRRWQEIEDASIAGCSETMEKTQNPLIRLVMEIIRQDSTMHRKVQQAMLDSLEKEAFSLTPEELGDLWEGIERHAAMEKETIELAETARRNCRPFVLRHLLTYLIEDERKHDRLLAQLEDFKRSIYPYA
jgi:rubrerythrin